LASIGSNLSALALAWYGFGVWALVLRDLLTAGLTFLISSLWSDYRFGFRASRHELRQIMSFSRPMFLTRALDITADTLIDWWECEASARSWSLETGFRYLSTIAEVMKRGRRYLHGRPLPTTEARERMGEERRTAAGRAASLNHIHPIADPEAIERLIEAAARQGLEAAAFVIALIDSGAREGEVRALRWRCIAWGIDEDDRALTRHLPTSRPTVRTL